MAEKTLQYQTMRIAVELEHAISVLNNIKKPVAKMNEDIIEITE